MRVFLRFKETYHEPRYEDDIMHEFDGTQEHDRLRDNPLVAIIERRFDDTYRAALNNPAETYVFPLEDEHGVDSHILVMGSKLVATSPGELPSVEYTGDTYELARLGRDVPENQGACYRIRVAAGGSEFANAEYFIRPNGRVSGTGYHNDGKVAWRLVETTEKGMAPLIAEIQDAGIVSVLSEQQGGASHE
jgi:hypothetical protein